MTVYGPRPAADPTTDFRPLAREDFAPLVVWLDEPHLAPWWRDPHGPGDLGAAFGAATDGDDPTEVRSVTIGDGPVGLVQRHLVRHEPAWRAALVPIGVPTGV